MKQKIIITGATGLIGSRLSALLASKGYEIIVFTRDIKKGKEKVPSASGFVEWDYHKPENWGNRLDGCYAVIHLAGVSIGGGRVNEKYKKKIVDSKINSTKNLVKAMSSVSSKPKVFLCPSGVNYYGDCGNDILTENASNGNDFLANLCIVWEKEAAKVEEFGIRRVSLRTSPVLSTKDGFLRRMLPFFKLYLGATLGNGKQWLSWIHPDDIAQIYLYALENNFISGAINATSPNPLRMEEFAKIFGKVLKRPALFTVPKFVISIIAGEAANFITASLRVIPESLLNSGYSFKFPELRSALADIVENSK